MTGHVVLFAASRAAARLSERAILGAPAAASARQQLALEDLAGDFAADPAAGVDGAAEVRAGPDARRAQLVGERRAVRPAPRLLRRAVAPLDGAVDAEQPRQLDFEDSRATVAPVDGYCGLFGARTIGAQAASRSAANGPAIALSGRQCR